jgi:hypothetical protein
VWRQDWGLDCRPVGSGQAALKYLAPSVLRVALSNHHILSIQDGQVTFRYQDGATRQTKTCTLPADACIARLLQHILPRGFVKVRYYGLFRVGARQPLARLRTHLLLQQRVSDLVVPPVTPAPAPPPGPTCPNCRQPMQHERMLSSQRAPPAPVAAT